MTDFQIEYDWQDPAGAKGQELRATWASLSITIDGHCVTTVLDTTSKSVRSGIFLPLFPLAEWIANNWWFLRAEVDRQKNPNAIEFERRHDIRWAREGFALPSLRFVTLGNSMEAKWKTSKLPDAGIEFLSAGQAILPGKVVTEKLRSFVNTVLARLNDMSVLETTLHEQWEAIENADAEEQAFCLAAAKLGLDPYAMDSQLEAAILDVAKSIRAELLNDFLSLANSQELHIQAEALKAATNSIATDTDNIDALKAIRAKSPQLVSETTPWDTGYHFARQLRKSLNGGGWKSRSVEDLAGHVGIDQLDHCLLQTSSACHFMDALVGTNVNRSPKFILEKSRDDARQFAFCRAIFEYLTSPPGSFAAVSRLQTERQQMSRAFAAEFLAPKSMLKNDLSAEIIDEEEIDDLAAEYGVSAFVIRHQVENHRLAQVSG